MEIFPFNKEKYIEFRKFLECRKISIQKFWINLDGYKKSHRIFQIYFLLIRKILKYSP